MIKELWQHHKLLLLSFIVALMAMGFFGVRMVADAIYWNDPAHSRQDLAPWMTPGYVAQSYHLPRDLLEDALLLERGAQPRRVRLDELAAENGLTLQDLQVRVDTAVVAAQARREHHENHDE